MEARQAEGDEDVPRRGVGDRHGERGHGAVLARGETVIAKRGGEPHVQDLCRLLVELGERDRGHRHELAAHPGVERHGGGVYNQQRSHRGRSVHRPGRRHRGEIVIEDAAASTLAAMAVLREARRQHRARREERPRPPAGALVATTSARDPEDRRRAVAAVPGRPDVDRGCRRHAGARDDHDLREDVRESRSSSRTSCRHGRADHPLRPAPGHHRRPGAAGRRADLQPRHPGRHGHAPRGSARKARARSATSTRSTAATSASTSGCARSVPGSSAARADHEKLERAAERTTLDAEPRIKMHSRARSRCSPYRAGIEQAASRASAKSLSAKIELVLSNVNILEAFFLPRAMDWKRGDGGVTIEYDP